MGGLVQAEDPPKPVIAVHLPTRTERVDFDRELLPILRANCLPCHNKTTTKADLVLETPAAMQRGGENGPAIVAGKSMASLLMQVSTHEVKPRMPPKDNKVNAVNLTPEQLGLLALWIDQGAPESPKHEENIIWQALPGGLNPIFAVAVTGNGRYTACGRGNRVDVYRVQDGSFLGRLADAALGDSNNISIAHRDEVHALAFSPDGEWLASGGFREAKLWRRSFSGPPLNRLPSTLQPVATLSTNGEYAVEIINGRVLLADAAVKHFVMALNRNIDAEEFVAASAHAVSLRKAERDASLVALDAVRKELDSQRERIKKAGEAHAAAGKEADARDTKIAEVRHKESVAELAVLKSTWETLRPKSTAEQRKSAAAKLEEAKKETAKTIEESKPQKQKLESARIELELATQTVARYESQLLTAEWRKRRAQAEVVTAESVHEQASKEAERGCPKALAVVLADGGRAIVSSHVDKKLRIWRTDGTPVDTIPLPYQVAAMSAGDNDYVAVKSETGGWNSFSVTPHWDLEHRLGSEKSDSIFADQVTALAFRPDGKRLAAGSGEPTRTGDITVWDPATGQLLYSLPALHSDTVMTLAFSPDGWSLASGGADRFARISDTTTARPARALEGHTGHVLGVAWSPDGRKLATASADLSVKYWDPATGEKSKQATGFTKEVTGISFLASRDRAVAASGESELRVINESGEKVESFHGTSDFTYALGVTADGKWVVAGGQDGVLRIWQAGKPEPAFQLAAPPVVDSKTPPTTVNSTR